MSVFGIILVRIFLHSDWTRRDIQSENTDQNNSEYEHFLRSYEILLWDYEIMRFDIIFVIRYIFTTIAIIQKQPFSNGSSK